MIVVPKDKPVVLHLNSYYINVERLIEHYQSELKTGAVHFKSAVSAGAVYFDEENIINVTYQDQTALNEGVVARDKLIKALKINNFTISVYQIDEFKIFFWANLLAAQDLYQNLTTDFTELKGLIKKMSNEKLTGYIDVSISEQKKSGLIFFYEGIIIGAECDWENKDQVEPSKIIAALIFESKQSPAVFHVRALDLNKIDDDLPSGSRQSKIPPHVLVMIHDLIYTFEMRIRKSKKIKSDFQTLLRKKFIEKADVYDFLDPFAAEFKYTREKVDFYGDASPELLINGVLESISELADDLGLSDLLQNILNKWFEQYSDEISMLELNLRSV